MSCNLKSLLMQVNLWGHPKFLWQWVKAENVEELIAYLSTDLMCIWTCFSSPLSLQRNLHIYASEWKQYIVLGKREHLQLVDTYNTAASGIFWGAFPPEVFWYYSVWKNNRSISTCILFYISNILKSKFEIASRDTDSVMKD